MPWPRAVTPPSADMRARGAAYVLQVGHGVDSPGTILQEPGVVRWRYQTQPRRNPWSVANLIRKPEFVVVDGGMQEVLRIRRSKRTPVKFDILDDGNVVGTIGHRSILRNAYTLDLRGGITWRFRMPLFTVLFHGKSNRGSQLWALVGPSKMRWNLLVEPGADSVDLLAALAFVHWEWWCYG
jgi:hypothetical protein